MLRKLILLVCLSGILSNGYSQDTDSLTFAKSKWLKKSIGSKSKLITQHFKEKKLFGSSQNISYIEVKNKKQGGFLAVGQEIKRLRTTSSFGKSYNALAAINGTFFDVKNGGSVDFVKVKDSVTAINRLDGSGTRSAHQKAAITIKNGFLSVKKWDGSADWESMLNDDEVMVSGPLLMIDGVNELLDSGSFSITRHPRSAIGISGNKVILLTVDGRHENSAGMNLFELTRIMKLLGCSAVINLDGGGSTTLWVNDENGNGVINYPSDNKKWDHHGERNVANVILLKKKP